MDFPVSYELNGPDTFLLQLDALMRKRSGRGNICHFLVTLASPLDRETVQQHLSRQPIVQWLATLRLRGGRGYSPPRWCVDPKASLPPIPFAPLPATDSGDVLGTTVSVNPRQASPFQIRLFGCDPQTTHVLFVWHHALMDAHGAELLVTYLGQALDAEPLFFDPDPLRPNHREWKLALGIKETLYAITRYPFMSTCRGLRRRHPTLLNDIVPFDAQETAAVDAAIAASGARVNRSHYYLAACARAVTTVVAERGDPVGDIVVTLPQDRRRRGAAGPILMNQVTFLFYRIPAAALDSMSGTVAELAKQMMDLMRQDFPALFLRMMLLFRYLPPWLHRFLLQQPTRKRMASFFFSDTGHSLDGFTHFMGVPVLTASHIPPNMVPPGLTFIFSRCQGRLAISLGSTAEDIRSEERDRLVDQLRRELLGAPAH